MTSSPIDVKRLSSSLTFVYRTLYPIFFGGMTAIFFLAELFGALRGKHGELSPWYVKWIILAAGGVATIWAVIQARLIQEIEMDEKKIRVSGSLGIDEIALTSIWAVEETRLQNPKLVILHISPTSRYGEIVRFIPAGMGILFGEHPIVTEVNRAIKAAVGSSSPP